MNGKFAVYIWHAIEDVPKLVTLAEYKEKYGGNDYTTARLFIRFDDPLYDEPKLVSVFYPVGKFPLSRIKDLDGTEARSRGYGGTYADKFGTMWRMNDGPDTLPDKEMTITAEVPRPRKKETKWTRGRWEYWTKTRGWQPVS